MVETRPESGKGIRKSLRKSNLISFIILIVFVLLAFTVERFVKPSFTATGLLAVGCVMALIPAAVWLIYFYRQDQLCPEPKSMVLSMAVLGALLAGSIGIPLVENVFKVSDWIYDSVLTNILGAILVVGFTQEYLKYAALRFTVFYTSEFDERDDGIIYGTAAGVGFATALNISYIMNTGGALLGVAAVRMVLTVLAQASFAGICGYFLSKEKLDQKQAWWMPLGLVLAAVLNGIFFYLYGTLTQPRITIQGGFINPWIGLVLAAIFAAVITYILTKIIERDELNEAARAA